MYTIDHREIGAHVYVRLSWDWNTYIRQTIERL